RLAVARQEAMLHPLAPELAFDLGPAKRLAIDLEPFGGLPFLQLAALRIEQGPVVRARRKDADVPQPRRARPFLVDALHLVGRGRVGGRRRAPHDAAGPLDDARPGILVVRLERGLAGPDHADLDDRAAS